MMFYLYGESIEPRGRDVGVVPAEKANDLDAVVDGGHVKRSRPIDVAFKKYFFSNKHN
jgi:hypothetical protein